MRVLALVFAVVLSSGEAWAVPPPPPPASPSPPPSPPPSSARPPAATPAPAPAPSDGASEPDRPSAWLRDPEATRPSVEETFDPESGAYVVRPPSPPPPPPPPPPCSTCGESDRDYDDLEAAWGELHAMGGWASLDDYGLGIPRDEDEPEPLRGRSISLDGEGPLLGGGFRAGYQTDDGVRFGAGFGGYVIEDLRLRGGRLDRGVRATLDDVVALRGELALGKAFEIGPVWPYLDAVVAVNVVTAEIRLETPTYGFVGQSVYLVPSATVAPRAGVFIPLSDEWFLDVAAQYGLFGVERGELLLGLGVWDD